MKKNKQKNKVNPDRMIQTIEENFKSILSKPNLKNLALTTIAIPFRKRAIPIAFKVYTNQQIRDMEYLSENYIIWNFLDTVIDILKMTMSDRRFIFVFDRGFADEKLMRYMEYFSVDYVIRVPKNSGIVGMEYKGKLSSFGQRGYFKDMFYHIRERVKINLLSSENPSNKADPFLWYQV